MKAKTWVVFARSFSFHGELGDFSPPNFTLDFLDFKNHIGMFQEPKAVWIEVGFLASLPLRELRSGFAEVIKHCLIADREEWDYLSGQSGGSWDWTAYFKHPEGYTENREELLQALHHLVSHSVGIKSEVVASDPREKGRRKILNFGHTLGHAIESYLLNDRSRRLLHGEAIAWGMIGEAFISYQRGELELAGFEQIRSFIEGIYEKPNLGPEEIEEVIQLTYQDKKNEGNRVLMSLLPVIGSASFNQEVGEAEMREALGLILE
ncbi:MAG: 3-dehydroquinate synthase family protein [Bacteroidota bacterium]